MTDAQEKWLFEHLGHTQDVHMLHYRQTSSVIERVEIAKLCMMQDCNLVKQFVGKSLDEIKEIPFADVVYNEPEGEQKLVTEHQSLPDIYSNVDDEEMQYNEDVYEQFDEDTFFGSDDEERKTKGKKRKKPVIPVCRDKWTAEDIDEVHRYFAQFLKAGKCPGIGDCEKVRSLSKKNGGNLWKKKRDNIKKKVSYMNCKSRNAQK